MPDRRAPHRPEISARVPRYASAVDTQRAAVLAHRAAILTHPAAMLSDCVSGYAESAPSCSECAACCTESVAVCAVCAVSSADLLPRFCRTRPGRGGVRPRVYAVCRALCGTRRAPCGPRPHSYGVLLEVYEPRRVVYNSRRAFGVLAFHLCATRFAFCRTRRHPSTRINGARNTSAERRLTLLLTLRS